VFSGASGQQRTVVEVERVGSADLDARNVVVAGHEVQPAAWTSAAAGSAERRRRVGRLSRPRTLLAEQRTRDAAMTTSRCCRRARRSTRHAGAVLAVNGQHIVVRYNTIRFNFVRCHKAMHTERNTERCMLRHDLLYGAPAFILCCRRFVRNSGHIPTLFNSCFSQPPLFSPASFPWFVAS